MKKLKNLIRKKISQELGLVDMEDLDKSNKFCPISFSTFDHWLTEEEADNTIFFYEEDTENSKIPSFIEYFKNEKKFINFYNKLFKFTIVYGVLYAENGRAAYVKFDNIEEYNSHALLSIREQLFLKIILPKYYAVITGGHDLTHILHIFKDKLSKANELINFIKARGLYILD